MSNEEHVNSRWKKEAISIRQKWFKIMLRLFEHQALEAYTKLLLQSFLTTKTIKLFQCKASP